MSDKHDDLSPALPHRGPREQQDNSVTYSKDAQQAQHAHKLLNRVKNLKSAFSDSKSLQPAYERGSERDQERRKPPEGRGRPQSAKSLAKNKKQPFSEILCEHNRRRPRSAAGQLKLSLSLYLSSSALSRSNGISVLECVCVCVCVCVCMCVCVCDARQLAYCLFESLCFVRP